MAGSLAVFYGTRFRQPSRRRIGLAVTAAYFGLFWHKWLG